MSNGQPVNRHIHKAEAGVVVHFLLSVEGHSVVGGHPLTVDEIPGLHEHSAASAGGVEQDSAPGFEDVHNHLDQRFRREEYAVVRGHVLCELVQEILVNAPDNVAAHVVQRAVVEDFQQFGKQAVVELRVVLGENARE